jgi:hypothetical protein
MEPRNWPAQVPPMPSNPAVFREWPPYRPRIHYSAHPVPHILAGHQRQRMSEPQHMPEGLPMPQSVSAAQNLSDPQNRMTMQNRAFFQDGALRQSQRVAQIRGPAAQETDITKAIRESLQDELQTQIDSREKCPICIERCKNPVITPCAHVFCSGCIQTAMRNRPICPMCRSSLANSGLIPQRRLTPLASQGTRQQTGVARQRSLAISV